MSSIFVIDDDKALCRSLEIQMAAQGYEVKFANTASDGLAALAEWKPDLILLDLKLPDQSGLDVLHTLEERQNDAPVVIITGKQDMKATIEAMRSGAFDYLRKPFEIEDVVLAVEKAKRFKPAQKVKRSEMAGEEVSDQPNEIVGADKKIVNVIKQIGLLSRSRVTVLIEGESGTGKELVARALHEATCPDSRFVAINCSAVVPTLPESELFGYEKGAFTGATSRKIGKLEYAGEGTVFFDEIGDMMLELQAKILRVIQEREFQRVGGLESIPFKARVIAATNRNLESLVKQKKFRQDLYFRFAVSRIALPSLRERRGDLRLLVPYLIKKIGSTLHRQVEGIEERAMRRLESYDWPGNVRELENVLTRAVALARGSVISAEDLEFSLESPKEKASAPSELVPLEQVEKEHIRKTLFATGWNITRSARILQISPTTLRKKIADFQFKGPD